MNEKINIQGWGGGGGRSVIDCNISASKLAFEAVKTTQWMIGAIYSECRNSGSITAFACEEDQRLCVNLNVT